MRDYVQCLHYGLHTGGKDYFNANTYYSSASDSRRMIALFACWFHSKAENYYTTQLKAASCS